jgi:DNA polymerase elongation subunit (family B)
MAYRNLSYDNQKGCIHLWTWDEDGNRIKLETSYEPSLYVESNAQQDGLSIFNTPLKKLTFKNNYYRNKFVNETPIKRIFQNLNVEQDFLINTFREDQKTKDLSGFPLKIYFWDLETFSPEKFPEPSQAEDPINLITIYDSLKKKYYSWGTKRYSSKESNEIYYFCENEYELLEKFLQFWEKDPPDIMCGWNTETFDVPYLINRIKQFKGDEYNRLSPIQNVYCREGVVINKYNKPFDKWYISGVSNLDYMIIYKAFSRGDSESYSLNFIAEKELKEGKIDFGTGNLAELSESDWDTFVKYNIQDVRLLVKLEETLKYLDLVRNLSYKGFIPFEKATGKVSMITGAIAHEALLQGKMIPTFKSDHEKQEYVGGYVHDPERGLQKSLVSYDANSLYPNTIITLNISPETKIGKILEKTDDEYKLSLINGKIISLSKEKFLKLVEREKICISDYDVLYTQKTKGVVPCYIDKLYKQRVDAKNEMQKYQKEISNITDKAEKQKIKQKIQDLDTQQNVYKLVLNSIYGTFAQKFSPLYDIDHSASVTMTGQSVIKKASDIVFDYMRERGFSGEKSGVYLYSDTDSIFFTIEPILNNEKETLLNDKKEVTQTAEKIIDEIDQKLNKEIIDWSKQKHNSIDPRFVFKRETICDKGLFLEKKMYILHVIDKEGTKPKKPFVYKGVELAKSTMSKEVKDLIRNVVESIILSEDKKESDNIFIESYKKFLEMDTNLISTRKKITDITKYESRTVGFKTPKGTPNHVKASIFFNNLLKSYNIEHLYERISSGNKVKIFYVSKNKYNISVISYNEVFPEEIKKDIIPDYEKMFKKTVSPPLERIYSCIGWNFPSLTCNYETDITSLFSEDCDE